MIYLKFILNNSAAVEDSIVQQYISGEVTTALFLLGHIRTLASALFVINIQSKWQVELWGLLLCHK